MARPSIGEAIFAPEEEKEQREGEMRLKLPEICQWMDHVRSRINDIRTSKDKNISAVMRDLRTDPTIPSLIRQELLPIFLDIDNAIDRVETRWVQERQGLDTLNAKQQKERKDSFEADARWQGDVIRFLIRSEHPRVAEDFWNTVESVYGPRYQKEYRTYHSGVIGVLGVAHFLHDRMGFAPENIFVATPRIDAQNELDLIAYKPRPDERSEAYFTQVKSTRTMAREQAAQFQGIAVQFHRDKALSMSRIIKNRPYVKLFTFAQDFQKAHQDFIIVPTVFETFAHDVNGVALLNEHTGRPTEEFLQQYRSVWDSKVPDLT